MNTRDDGRMTEAMTEAEKMASRDRMLALLEANHVFPGPFHFSIVAHNRDEVAELLRTVIVEHTGPIAPGSWHRQHSAKGTYVSHRITVACDSASQVVILFERFHALEGVIQIL